jgi:hypothetical protein
MKVGTSQSIHFLSASSFSAYISGSWLRRALIQQNMYIIQGVPFKLQSEDGKKVKVTYFHNQSSWLQIQRSGNDSRRHQIFWEVASLERGPLSLVSTTEELLERKSSGTGLESREYGLRDPSHWPRGTIYLHKLTLTSPTNGGRSVGIVRSRNQDTECLFP